MPDGAGTAAKPREDDPEVGYPPTPASVLAHDILRSTPM
jgi:hypothetical protein